jgi:hypothetical protein
MNIRSLTKQVKQYYRQNIDTILSYRSQSGRYGLNPAKVEEWIRAQHTPRREEVARLLINQVHYFTYSETFDLFFDVVSKMENLRGKSIYILIQPIHDVGQSTFMFAMLGYHVLINILNIPIRDIHFTYAPVDDGENVIFDDFSYSGSQIMQTINQFYEINKDMSLHICLLGASKYAYDIIKLKPIRFGRHDYKRLERYGYLPSNYHFYVGKIIDSYDVDMSEKDKNDVAYFFNPFKKLGKTLVYFDHKIADESSTLMFVLKHGLVIPQNYFINVKLLKKFNSSHIENMVLPEMEPLGGGNEIKAFYLIDECQEDLTGIKQYVSFLLPIKENPEIEFSEDRSKQINQLQEAIEEGMEFEDNDFKQDFVEYIDFYMSKYKTTIDDYILGFNLKRFFEDRQIIIRLPRCPVSFYKQEGVFKRERNISVSSRGSTRRSPAGSIRRLRTTTRKSPRKGRSSRSTRRKSL